MINSKDVNPEYVQIGKKEASEILGFSITELDRRRRNDPNCPKGFKRNSDRMAPVYFRLSDIYAYSAHVMEQAIPAETG